MQIDWSPRALRNLRQVRVYIARENPAAARAVARAIDVARAIEDQVNRLRLHPRRGKARPGGFRETVEPRYRYVVRYDLLPDEPAPTRVHILSIWHPNRRDRTRRPCSASR
ncbi:hypothetical protein CKO28_18255 [Rhodovibrio sodomensis]|uniref:Type II toxin-antitoxin system RelE/ParE family toxin n=1 Tax=Rhodovibrio sodomensis TaxID=1088 RepID=A0ABS1DKV6_9PROT|nr:hypothetical protein [Rhodovibrio sodomensis]